jgi:hypothetical protein
MAQGEVLFTDEKLTQSTFTVTNGQFEGKSEAGNFKVEISSLQDATVAADPTGYAPPGGTTKKNVVLPDYNANSKLKAEVKASGPNEYAFEAKTK